MTAQHRNCGVSVCNPKMLKTLSFLEQQHITVIDPVSRTAGKVGSMVMLYLCITHYFIVLHVLNNLIITLALKCILLYTLFKTVVSHKMLSNLLKSTQPLGSRMKMLTHTVYLELLSTILYCLTTQKCGQVCRDII